MSKVLTREERLARMSEIARKFLDDLENRLFKNEAVNYQAIIDEKLESPGWISARLKRAGHEFVPDRPIDPDHGHLYTLEEFFAKRHIDYDGSLRAATATHYDWKLGVNCDPELRWEWMREGVTHVIMFHR